MTDKVVAGQELIKAFAIRTWRDAEPGIAFDQVLELAGAIHDEREWMELAVFTDVFGFDMVRHVKVVERPASC